MHKLLCDGMNRKSGKEELLNGGAGGGGVISAAATRILTTVTATSKSYKADTLVYFNVSGRSFVTTTSTLENCPNTLLGSDERRQQLPRNSRDEIFLNRNAEVFENVLTFYQYGIFEQPDRVNHLIFLEDLKYYELLDYASACNVKGIKRGSVHTPRRKWQAFLWQLVEIPDSSLGARILSLFSLLTILASIFIFCIETLPEYRKPASKLTHTTKRNLQILNAVETFCIVYFSLEIIVRFFVSPTKCKFAKDILNIVDLVSILPFYITMAFNTEENVSIYILRVIRLARVFRVFKLTRHSNEMKILGIAVKDSGRELGVLVFFILLGVLLFSSAIYYAEAGVNGTKMTSIPQSFWWSIVTMTTVGYGDEVPISTAGRIVGAVCAMTGILVIAMPIPIIVNNFARQYQIMRPASLYWGKFADLACNHLNTKGLFPAIGSPAPRKTSTWLQNNNSLQINNNQECVQTNSNKDSTVVCLRKNIAESAIDQIHERIS